MAESQLNKRIVMAFRKQVDAAGVGVAGEGAFNGLQKVRTPTSEQKTKKPHSLDNCAALSLVPEAGIEPARLAAGDFESPASTNSTTRADIREDPNYGTVAA